jgi:hypothetical protein
MSSLLQNSHTHSKYLVRGRQVHGSVSDCLVVNTSANPRYTPNSHGEHVRDVTTRLLTVDLAGKYPTIDHLTTRWRATKATVKIEQIADNAFRFVLALDGGRHDLVEGGLHAIEFELAHEVEQLSTFHQMVLLRLS